MKRSYTILMAAFAMLFSAQVTTYAQRTVFPLPYFETFDTLPVTAGSKAEGWTNVHIQGQYPAIRSQSNMTCSGSQVLTTSLLNNTQYTLTATPAFVVPAEGLEVSWCCVLGNPNGILQVGIMTNVAAENTFSPLYNTKVNTLLGRTGGVLYYDASHAGDTVHVAFKCINNGTASCMFYVDNVKINAAPAHHQMSASVVDTTDHSLTLSWNAQAGVDHYELAYASQNILNSAVATYINNITDTFCVVNNLQMGTPYYLWMRSVYATDTTEWTAVDIVYTKLADITDRYEMDFEGDPYGNPYVPAGWSRVTVRTSRPFIKQSALCNDAQLLEMAGNATYNSMAATPRVVMPNGEARCTFTYYCAYNATLQYGILTSVSDETSFVVLGTVEDTVAPCRTITINLDTIAVPDTFYVAFRFQGKTGVAYGLIDNVKIWREVPVCDRPVQVVVSNIGMHVADITVRGNDSTQVNFELVCTTADSVQALDSIIVLTDTVYHLENLSTDNTYSVFVRTVCDSVRRSEWFGPTAFTTLGCNMPDSVSAIGVGTHVATIVVHHQAADTVFEYRIGRSADIAGADTSLAVPADTIEFEDLLAATTYYVWVRTQCGEADWSNWTDAVVFTTDSAGNNAIVSAEQVAGIVLYPNPTTSRVTIANVDAQAQISIIDVSGREVKSMTVAKGSKRVDIAVADLPRGCYYVRVADAKRQSVSKLILR